MENRVKAKADMTRDELMKFYRESCKNGTITDDELQDWGRLSAEVEDEWIRKNGPIEEPDDSWLLALNFEEMDRREADPNYDPANDPTCVPVTLKNDEE